MTADATLPAMPPKRPVPTAAELEQAASELQQKLAFYLRGYRSGEVAKQVEPLLRHWLVDYGPKVRQREERLDRELASAAWQLLFLVRGGMKAPDEIAGLVRGVGQLRRERGADEWPDEEEVLLRVRQKLARKKATDLTRVDGIWRAFQGLEDDPRRGVRPERAEILQRVLSEAPTLTKWRLANVTK